MDKVLNRPLFRKEALRKGAIKPIHAQTGIMVGQPINNPNPQINPRTQVPALRPNIMRRAIGDLRAFAQRPGQFFNPKVNRFRPGAGTAALIGVEGLAPIIGAGRRKLGLSDESAFAPIIDYGLGGLLTMTPIGRAVGLTALAGRAALGTKDYVQGKKIGTTMSALSPNLGEPLGLFNTPISGATARRKSRRGELSSITLDEIAKANEQGFTVSPRKKARQGQQTTDVATSPQNTTQIGDSKLVDTAKISENAVNNQQQFDEGDLQAPPIQAPPIAEEKKQQKDRFGFTKKDSKEGEADIAQNQANKDALVVESPYMAAIKEAKAMAAEMRKGRASQNQLVFLSNLASGLLTGTTNRRGLSGALDVFGKALGPAVNNMVMVKMKENELDQNLLGRALEFQSDFLKAQNDAFEMPDTEETGVIQIQNDVGRIVNVPGRILKDGTKQRATGEVNSRGTNIYVTVDPSFNFIPNKDQNKETLEIAGDIAGKYAAVNLINRSLAIITEGKAEAGVTGAIGLYGGRLTEALGDVFNFVKPSGDTKAELKTSGKAMFELERNFAANRLIKGGDFETKEEALKYLDASFGDFNDIYNNSLNNARKRLKGGKKLDYERLAINETVLVYKLANSLKSKDRLTQKDIDMAKGLVKVFPAFRGEINVIASLTATAETILDDIKQQERLYERAGGSTQYLLNERRAYGLGTGSETLNTFTGDLQGGKKREELKEFEERVKELLQDEERLQNLFPPELFRIN